MGFTTFYGFDTSRWQGPVTQADLDAAKAAGKTFWLIKGSGGDDGLYVDSQFEASLALARANPWLKVGVYHFAGMTDAATEANYAVDNVWSKLLPGEVPILDVDRASSVDPAWAKSFFAVSDTRTGIPDPIYMNQNTENSYDWGGVTNRSLIIADYAISPDGNVGLRNWPFYFGQQYSSTGTIGSLNPVDLDAIFVSSIDAWDKIAIQPVAPPPPAPVPPTIPPPTSSNPTPPATSGTNIDGVIPVTVKPPVPPAPVIPPTVVTTPSTTKQDTLDVLIRSVKTWLATMVAVASAGGLNISHLGATNNVKIGALAGVATAILNIVIKYFR